MQIAPETFQGVMPVSYDSQGAAALFCLNDIETFLWTPGDHYNQITQVLTLYVRRPRDIDPAEMRFLPQQHWLSLGHVILCGRFKVLTLKIDA